MKYLQNAIDDVSEYCVTLIKPGTKKPDIVCYFLNKGHRPNASPGGLFHAFLFNEDILKEFYPHLVSKPFWNEFVEFMTSDQCLVGVFKGVDIIQPTLKFIGEKTDPKKNELGTVRYIFGDDVQNNAVHCSKTFEDAKRELEVLKKHGII